MKIRSNETKSSENTGSVAAPTDKVSLTRMWKQWRDKVRLYSLLAALPGIAAANSEPARAETLPVDKTARALRALQRFYTPRLTRRRGPFNGQQASFDLLGTMMAKDNCPGQLVPPGTYTSTQPYVDSGDTTGANNTVHSLGFGSPYGYMYGNYYVNAYGPDHIYRFELTGRGPDPEIKVTTSSSVYRPMIYVLTGFWSCPNANVSTIFGANTWSGFDSGDKSTRMERAQINDLPLNHPLFLFVDSHDMAPYGAGPYTVRFQDVTLSDAAAFVSGRVTAPGGLGLRNASVYLIDPQGARSVVMTGSLGYFKIEGVEAGKTYQIGVSSKRYRFESRGLEVNGNLTEVNFTGLE